jgi:hypothetical protein
MAEPASPIRLNSPDCEVPGCHDPRDRGRCNAECGPRDCENHVCCKRHSGNLKGQAAGRYLSNEGIIDWQAIDVITEGIRVVRLTWVEAAIAVAELRLRGLPENQIKKHLGLGKKCYVSRHAEMNEETERIMAALTESEAS